MKLRLPVQHLAAAVAHTVRAVPARPVVPVMAGILLTTAADGLHLAASDHDTYAGDRVHAEIAGDGRILVPGRLLNEICARLPKGCDVDLDADGSRLTIACRGSRFSLPLLPADEYPALPALPPAVATVGGEDLAGAVAQVAAAACTDDALPALSAVHTVLDGGRLDLTATDRYRIARRSLTVQPAPAAGTGAKKTGRKNTGTDPGMDADVDLLDVLIPAKTFADAARAYDHDRPVTLHSDGVLWGWSSCGSTLMTRLIDAQFPKNCASVPETAGAVAAPAAELLAALQRVALVANANTPVRLTLDDGRGLLRIEAGSGDDAHAVDRIEVTVSGDLAAGEYTIAFNPGYLIDGIKAAAATEVVLHLGDRHKPAVVTARTGATDEDIAALPYRYVIMPVRLK